MPHKTADEQTLALSGPNKDNQDATEEPADPEDDWKDEDLEEDDTEEEDEEDQAVRRAWGMD